MVDGTRLTKFDGTDPESWISNAEEVFKFYKTEDSARITMAAFYFDGKARRWYRWMKLNRQLSSWSHFTKAMRDRFQNTDLEPPQGYQSRFETLSNQTIREENAAWNQQLLDIADELIRIGQHYKCSMLESLDIPQVFDETLERVDDVVGGEIISDNDVKEMDVKLQSKIEQIVTTKKEITNAFESEPISESKALIPKHNQLPLFKRYEDSIFSFAISKCTTNSYTLRLSFGDHIVTADEYFGSTFLHHLIEFMAIPKQLKSLIFQHNVGLSLTHALIEDKPFDPGKLCIEVTSLAKIAFISEEFCIGCGICVKKIPRPGQVLGLVGTNCIGKSIARKVLAEKLKPNLGRLNNPPDWQEILNYFRGSELQNYFTHILEDNLNTIIKPQYVDHIPKAVQGNVGHVLDQKDERNIKFELCYDLQLNQAIERNVEDLSGGELQRFTIDVVAIQNAEIYTFDEPSSYNDVKQRLKAALVVRYMLRLNSYVIVVEHDLSVLDYLSDFICCLYGKPKTPHESAEEIETYVRYKYPTMTKTHGGFKLKVSEGEFSDSQFIVMLGENGTGKTTFICMLAGLLKPDEVEGSDVEILEFNVSYKPQKISPKFQNTVRHLLHQKIRDSYMHPQFVSKVMKQLLMEQLMDQEVFSLFEGELQRVASCLCLGKPAHIYLIDEPSAYLDFDSLLTDMNLLSWSWRHLLLYADLNIIAPREDAWKLNMVIVCLLGVSISYFTWNLEDKVRFEGDGNVMGLDSATLIGYGMGIWVVICHINSYL